MKRLILAFPKIPSPNLPSNEDLVVNSCVIDGCAIEWRVWKKGSSKEKKGLAKKTPKQTLVDLYRDMLLIRRFEEKAGQLYQQRKIAGFCHLYDGQEAVVCGLKSLMHEGDTVITSYRDHGHILACGVDPKKVMAELLGKRTGSSKGKGGSMHLFSKEHNFYGGHGIVGAQVSIGTGLAFSHKYREEPYICFAYLGDGAANQGQVYESFNMASLWSLPIIYVIENNHYAMGTSVTRACAAPNLAKRGSGFGIPGQEVNGMDIMAMRESCAPIIDKVRSGGGPFIIEALTYRYHGHSMTDPAKYRTREEVASYRTQDPLKTLSRHLVEKLGILEDDLKALDKAVRQEVVEAVNAGLEDPEPTIDELYTDVMIDAI